MTRKIDPRRFRDALSSFATGVTIVTARDSSGEPFGMTANSFNSVSMDPPLVLWSVTKTALSANAFKEAKHWAVHVLATDQVALSNSFATSGADKFGEVDWAENADGVPILDGCVACFQCRAWQTYDGGDHWILVGEVVDVAREPREPLVFCSGSYAIAQSIRVSTTEEADVLPEVDSDVEDLLMDQLTRATQQMSQRFHDAVRKSGLTVAEWRVLAALRGSATRKFEELSVHTFLDPMTLADMLYGLQEQGLCVFNTMADVPMVSGTQAGHDRVSHLLKLGEELEQAAFGGADAESAAALKSLLRTLVNNT